MSLACGIEGLGTHDAVERQRETLAAGLDQQAAHDRKGDGDDDPELAADTRL